LIDGGWAIFSTFDLDGPEKCSGLPVVHYSPESLRRELGEGFELLDSRWETHRLGFGP